MGITSLRVCSDAFQIEILNGLAVILFNKIIILQYIHTCMIMFVY